MANTTFGKTTTSEEIAAAYGANAKGKYAVVTGANSGLGFETSRILAQQGAIVTVACRSEKNGHDTVAKIKAEFPDANLAFLQLDLGNFASIRSFASAYKATGNPINLMINNAGVMACPRTLTSDGLEMQLGVNHVGHFLLTTELMDEIRRGGTVEHPSRIINLSSLANYFFAPSKGLTLDDLNGEKHYDQWDRYGQSKLANILFTKELNKRFHQEYNGKPQVVSVSVHPGVIGETNLSQHVDLSSILNIMGKLLWTGKIFSFFGDGQKNIKQGSATTLFCALAPENELEVNAHYADCKVETKLVHHMANDVELPQKLWEASEEIVRSK